MTDQYEQACALVADKGNEYLDFHARRLVEMASHIIMSYLLLTDSQSNSNFIKSTEIFTNKSQAWNEERYAYISNFRPEDMAAFQSIREEHLEEA